MSETIKFPSVLNVPFVIGAVDEICNTVVLVTVEMLTMPDPRLPVPSIVPDMRRMAVAFALKVVPATVNVAVYGPVPEDEEIINVVALPLNAKYGVTFVYPEKVIPEVKGIEFVIKSALRMLLLNEVGETDAL